MPLASLGTCAQAHILTHMHIKKKFKKRFQKMRKCSSWFFFFFLLLRGLEIRLVPRQFDTYTEVEGENQLHKDVLRPLYVCQHV